MRKIFRLNLISCLIITLSLSACNGDQNSKASSVKAAKDLTPTTNNEQKPVSLSGTYEGTLPCADCDGIKTIIVLKDNHTYSKTEEYLGKNGATFTENGKFEMIENGNTITLINQDGNQKFKVEENKLIYLDINGEPASGKLADKYVLVKIQ